MPGLENFLFISCVLRYRYACRRCCPSACNFLAGSHPIKYWRVQGGCALNVLANQRVFDEIVDSLGGKHLDSEDATRAWLSSAQIGCVENAPLRA